MISQLKLRNNLVLALKLCAFMMLVNTCLPIFSFLPHKVSFNKYIVLPHHTRMILAIERTNTQLKLLVHNFTIMFLFTSKVKHFSQYVI